MTQAVQLQQAAPHPSPLQQSPSQARTAEPTPPFIKAAPLYQSQGGEIPPSLQCLDTLGMSRMQAGAAELGGDRHRGWPCSVSGWG